MAQTNVYRSLYVTDIKGVTEESTKEYDSIVTVCQDNVMDNVGCDYYFFNIADGPEEGKVPGDSSYELFEKAADTVRELFRSGERVLIHCHAGRSRSVCVAAAVMAVEESIDINKALWTVKKRRGMGSPSSHVRLNAQKYTNRR